MLHTELLQKIRFANKILLFKMVKKPSEPLVSFGS